MWNWVASAEDSHERSYAEEIEQTEIGELVKILGERANNEDAAEEETIRLCRSNMISDCRTCREVGVPEAKVCKRK